MGLKSIAYHVQNVGESVRRQVYNGDKEYFCDLCKNKIKNKEKAAQQNALDMIRTKKEQAYDKAVDIINKQVDNIFEYEKAIALCEVFSEKFGSIPEAMVAIELVRLGYKPIPQQKIGTYKVDFYLKTKN